MSRLVSAFSPQPVNKFTPLIGELRLAEINSRKLTDQAKPKGKKRKNQDFQGIEEFILKDFASFLKLQNPEETFKLPNINSPERNVV